jgi:hypothetical protein
VRRLAAEPEAPSEPRWEPRLTLERLPDPPGPIPELFPGEPVVDEPVEPAAIEPVVEAPAEEPDWLGRLDFPDEVVVQEPKKKARRSRPIGGSLLKADGTSEPSLVGML